MQKCRLRLGQSDLDGGLKLVRLGPFSARNLTLVQLPQDSGFQSREGIEHFFGLLLDLHEAKLAVVIYRYLDRQALSYDGRQPRLRDGTLLSASGLHALELPGLMFETPTSFLFTRIGIGTSPSGTSPNSRSGSFSVIPVERCQRSRRVHELPLASQASGPGR